jgi:hypothetical protein
MRRVVDILVLSALVCSLLLSTGVLAGGVRQPEPARPGVVAPEIEAAYRAVQADPDLTEETRVRAAVDTYFELKYESRIRGEALELSTVIDTASRAGKALRDYELGRLQYSLRAWQSYGLVFKDYNYRPVYECIDVRGRTARVIIRPWADLTYADVPDQPGTSGGEQHEITLTRSTDGWKVVSDVYDDDFLQCHPKGSDFGELEARLPQMLSALEARWAELAEKYRDDPRSRYQTGTSGTDGILGYRTYNRTKVTWYGTTYTDDTEGHSTTYYNKLFKSYESDCQNFASQCIWYGFGGSNTSTAINNHYLPMVYNVAGATCWWADSNTSDGGAPGPWHWANVEDFCDMIEENWSGDDVGVQGYEGSMNDVWPGDCITLSTWDHVFVVVRIDDHDHDGLTDYDEIYVSAHTHNLKDHLLADVMPTPDVHFMYIDTFKNP